MTALTELVLGKSVSRKQVHVVKPCKVVDYLPQCHFLQQNLRLHVLVVQTLDFEALSVWVACRCLRAAGGASKPVHRGHVASLLNLILLFIKPLLPTPPTLAKLLNYNSVLLGCSEEMSNVRRYSPIGASELNTG
ncbi:Hypothetical predicted protein [Xyrichtys novacula]|uniref:Uncharacterized protein n=1 Tax=Xyrichtys novacula TaxID=13765 RepID=A0AAV1GL39_XYRNO|nr:Hypothetical predicted protein [Xyrichtys novacula]